jgi:hypothetical protein
MAKAVDDGRIKCFTLQEGVADGDQYLNLWINDVEDVCQEIMEDPAGCADTAAEDGRSGSNIYEVNTWLWQFGRGKPCLGLKLGGLTIKETLDKQDSACKALDKQDSACKASDKHQKETSDGCEGHGA